MKRIGWIALFAWSLAVSMSFAQVPAPAEAEAAPEAPAIAAEAPAEAPVAAPAEAQEITIQGEVSVVNGPDGMLQAIYINPAEGHGYKVDLVNGEGKTLADKDGTTVEAVGVDANRLFTIRAVTVPE